MQSDGWALALYGRPPPALRNSAQNADASSSTRSGLRRCRATRQGRRLAAEVARSCNRQRCDSSCLCGRLASLGLNLQQKKWIDAEQVLRECLAILRAAGCLDTRSVDARRGGAPPEELRRGRALLVKGYQGMKARGRRSQRRRRSTPHPEAIDRLIVRISETNSRR